MLDRPAVRPLDSIVVGARHRKDMGDIPGLAREIERVGLLHPPVIRPNGELIAGERRLAALRLLGRRETPVTVVDLEQIARGEFSENTYRKDFTPSEIDAIRRTLAPLEKAAAKERMSEGGKGAKVSQPSRATDKIGAFAGVSGRTIEKIAAVVDAAEAEERFRPLVEDMDRSGKVDAAYQRLRSMRHDEERARIIAGGCTIVDLEALAASGFRAGAICPDPPWHWKARSEKGEGRSAKRHFEVESLEDILALAPLIQAFAAKDCVLFLWAIMPMLWEAREVIKTWGFEYKTDAFILIKTTPTSEFVTLAGDGLHWGNGYWTRDNAELCLLATRGAPSRINADVHEVILAPAGEHSEKPDEAYDRITRLVVGPYVELYARKERPGWTSWGNEIERASFAAQAR